MTHRTNRFLLVAALALGASPAPARAEDDSPKIRSVQPAYTMRGTVIDLVVEGKFLFPLTEVKVDRTDITVVPASAGNTSTRLLLKVTVAEEAPAGPVKLSIKTKTGTAVTEKFSVRLRAPTVAKVVPASLPRGKEYDVTITGTWLALPATETKVTVPAPITATKVPKKSDEKSILLKVVVPPEAPLGASAFTIETGDGKVAAPFTVAASPPTVAKVEPARVARGGAATLALGGENLAGSSVSLAVPDAAIRIEPLGAAETTSSKLRVHVDGAAVPGPRTLLLSTLDGTTSASFEVFVEPPVLSRVSPPAVARGLGADLLLEGTGIPKDATPRIVPADPAVTVEPPAPNRPPRLTVDAAATPGPRTFVVPTRDATLVGTVLVSLRAPHVAGFAPAEVAPGATTEVTVEGQNLGGSTWSVVPADPTVTVEAAAGDRLRVTASKEAKPGPRYLAARNADGVALGILPVTGSSAIAPVVTSIAPARVSRPGKTTVTLKGLNLLEAGGQPPAVRVEGPDGATLDATATSATSSSVVVELDLKADTKPGGYLVTVRTGEGGGAALLTVVPSSPAIASATPARLTRPAKVEVTLAGSGLVDPSGAPPKVTVARVDGAASIATEVLEAKADSLRLRLTLPADLAAGDLVVGVATPDGGAAVVLPVDPAPPEITSLTPRRIGVPSNVELRIEGKNLLSPDGKTPLLSVTRAGSASAIRPIVATQGNTAITVRISTAPGTPAGPHVLSIRTPDGVAAALFEVLPFPPPSIASIEVDGASPGMTVLTRIKGTGLKDAADVTFDGTGVNANVLSGGTDTELPIRIVVARDAKPGPRTFTLTGGGGTAASGKVVFTVR